MSEVAPKEFICKECKAVYKSRNSLHSQKRSYHLKPRLPCDRCDELFCTVSLRNAHLYKALYGSKKLNTCKVKVLEQKPAEHSELPEAELEAEVSSTAEKPKKTKKTEHAKSAEKLMMRRSAKLSILVCRLAF